ncbi:putative nuclease activity [Lyophyllum shimeji]|uniref:Nuclease activity n=1 Tax=Lyophyllum shimeji TaxID=47721 RepID=A0A9P3UPK0_LYOSH|nr:putative nuclease activity [Lyophyllum shimeji]
MSLKKPTHDAHRRSRHRKKCKFALLCLMSTATVAVGHLAPFLTRTPQHTSILTGEKWLRELLAGHPVRFYNMFGMNNKYIQKEEQLAIFLRMARSGGSNREMQERFQRSADTISKCFHRVLDLLISPQFYSRYVKLPSEEHTPPEIQKNPIFYPFFKDCLGAIDGTHIDAFVETSASAAYRNRKGRLSTNVLAACTFDLRFSYLLVGWEGSATDSRIFKDAREHGLAIPPGKFYLADAGFPSCDTLLVPYWGVRYHLKEWGNATDKPRDYKELFNLRHSQARNAVERIFGIVKRRFTLINAAPEYSIHTQSKIILATYGCSVDFGGRSASPSASAGS